MLHDCNTARIVGEQKRCFEPIIVSGSQIIACRLRDSSFLSHAHRILTFPTQITDKVRRNKWARYSAFVGSKRSTAVSLSISSPLICDSREVQASAGNAEGFTRSILSLESPTSFRLSRLLRHIHSHLSRQRAQQVSDSIAILSHSLSLTLIITTYFDFLQPFHRQLAFKNKRTDHSFADSRPRHHSLLFHRVDQTFEAGQHLRIEGSVSQQRVQIGRMEIESSLRNCQRELPQGKSVDSYHQGDPPSRHFPYQMHRKRYSMRLAFQLG